MINFRIASIAVLLIAIALNNGHARSDDSLSLSSINQSLSESESSFEDLVMGTERAVRWFDGVQQTDVSIIYLHGFSASRQELSPTTERLADALQANVFYARLKGHGRSADAMAEASVEAWLQDTKQAYQIGALIGKKVIVLSTSTGGTLASWLVTQPFANQLLTNIMISPNFGVNNKLGAIVRWSWGLALVKWLKGPYYSFEPLNDVHGQFWTERYPFEALLPMFDLLDLVKGLDKSRVSIPQMVIYSPQDKVVNTEKIRETVKQFSASAMTITPFTDSTDPYQHVLAGDACSPESTSAMVALLADYIKTLRN